MRPSATNVGLTAYVQNDSGEYTPQPFEMMSESQMVVFEHHIVGIRRRARDINPNQGPYAQHMPCLTCDADAFPRVRPSPDDPEKEAGTPPV